MNFKNLFQLELREAIRTHDRPRIDCLRMVLTACEKAQESMGKQSYESSPQNPTLLPDRQQALTRQAIAGILQAEIDQRREAADQFHAGGFVQHTQREETQIAILLHYLDRVLDPSAVFPAAKAD